MKIPKSIQCQGKKVYFRFVEPLEAMRIIASAVFQTPALQVYSFEERTIVGIKYLDAMAANNRAELMLFIEEI